MRTAFVLAWRLLIHDPRRLFLSLAGIGFAALLMLVQLGFRASLLDSSVALIDALEGELFVIYRGKRSFLQRQMVPHQRAAQVLAAEGVADAYSVYVDRVVWRNPRDKTLRAIRLLGFETDQPAFRLPAVRAHAAALRTPGTALVDRRSRDYYGPLTPGVRQVSRLHVDIIGQFVLGTDFEMDGNLIVGRDTFFRLSRGYGLKQVETVLVRLEPGADPRRVRDALRASLPPDVAVYTRAEMRARELRHWERATPVSIVFGIGVIVGFLVGVVICYQILYNDVADHLAEFATLKAIGFPDRVVVAAVMWEALLLAVTAFLPSLLAGWVVDRLLGLATGLTIVMTPERALGVLGLTLGMCVLAGLAALRQVIAADPAEVF